MRPQTEIPHGIRGVVPWCLLLALLGLAVPRPGACEPALEEAVARLREAQAAYAAVQDYVAVFHRQERVRGELQEPETIRLKFRKPFQVYMQWIGEAHAGRELLYVEGWNGNRLMAHEGGVLGFITLSLEPGGALALRHSRHPVTDTGIGRMLAVVSESLHRAVAAGELEVVGGWTHTIFGRPARRIEGRLPADPRKGYYAPRVVLDVDLESKLPIQIEIYDAEDRLLEKYGYENLQVNVGLSALDFESTNPDYRF
jgi:outer membrane lipoprotein-sorting protein